MVRRTWLWLSLLVLIATTFNASSMTLTGTWRFTVQLESGATGESTFVLTQKGTRLTGVYSGPIGEQKVTGTVERDLVRLSFEFQQAGGTATATYEGRVKNATSMSGTLTRVGPDGGVKGQWSATRTKP
jgi:hypothetical protein